jgi:hypothetical protein
MELSPEVTTQIVLAAVAAAGPDDGGGDWDTKVAMNAARITAMTSPQSAVGQSIAQVAGAKVFTGVVESIRKEQSSTRGVIVLQTRESIHHPDGREEVRTERTDKAVGLAMARRVRELRGHRVMVWVEIEEIANGQRKVRVLRHIEDLGAADKSASSPEPEPEPVASAAGSR